MRKQIIAMGGMALPPALDNLLLIEYFLRHAGPPKVLIVAFDARWCTLQQEGTAAVHGFPLWMYDDDPWNDYLHVLNSATLVMAARPSNGERFGSKSPPPMPFE